MARRSSAVHRVGAPLSANVSMLSEPLEKLRDDDSYIAISTGESAYLPGRLSALARLIRLRFPDHTIVVDATDALDIWRGGRLDRLWRIERASDRMRLTAWSNAFVDLHPGRLFSRRCVESLLFGTPVVVPASSRASEHARAGGGLWFENAGDLCWAVEALSEPEVARVFADKGRAYATSTFGPGSGFVDRVLDSVRLRTALDPKATQDLRESS